MQTRNKQASSTLFTACQASWKITPDSIEVTYQGIDNRPPKDQAAHLFTPNTAKQTTMRLRNGVLETVCTYRNTGRANEDQTKVFFDLLEKKLQLKWPVMLDEMQKRHVIKQLALVVEGIDEIAQKSLPESQNSIAVNRAIPYQITMADIEPVIQSIERQEDQHEGVNRKKVTDAAAKLLGLNVREGDGTDETYIKPGHSSPFNSSALHYQHGSSLVIKGARITPPGENEELSLEGTLEYLYPDKTLANTLGHVNRAARNAGKVVGDTTSRLMKRFQRESAVATGTAIG